MKEVNPSECFRKEALKTERERFAEAGPFVSCSDELLAVLLFLKGESEDREIAFLRLASVLNKELLISLEDPYFTLRAIPPVVMLLLGCSQEIPTASLKELRAYLQYLHLNLKEIALKEASSLSRFLKIRIDLASSMISEVMGEEPSLVGSKPLMVSIDDFFHPQLSQDLFLLLFSLDAVRQRHLERDTLDSLRLLWNDEEGVFLGPPLCSFQDGALPCTQPGDFWMSCLTGVSGKRLKHKKALLESALYPDEPLAFTHLGSIPVSVPSAAENWITPMLSLFAYPRGDIRLKPYWRAFHLVRGFIFGNGRVVSFSVQGKVDGEAAISKENLTIQVRFSYSDEQRGLTDPADLLGFYVDRRSGVLCTVNERQSTVYKLGDTLAFKGEFGKIEVVFSQVSGEAIVCGHISPGSRPAIEPGDGGDWVVYLRPVKLETKAVFLMTISLDGINKI